MIVVSDTSPISGLIKIGKLHLLNQLYGTLLIPPSVLNEVMALEDFGYEVALIMNSTWIFSQSPTDASLVQFFQSNLDLGEAEAIVLAKEMNADVLLIDERKGVEIAKRVGLKSIGLLGVLLQAKRSGIITAVKPVLDELISKGGFWISGKVRNEVLVLADETE